MGPRDSWRSTPSQASSTLGLCLPEAWLFSCSHLHQGLGERES